MDITGPIIAPSTTIRLLVTGRFSMLRPRWSCLGSDFADPGRCCRLRFVIHDPVNTQARGIDGDGFLAVDEDPHRMAFSSATISVLPPLVPCPHRPRFLVTSGLHLGVVSPITAHYLLAESTPRLPIGFPRRDRPSAALGPCRADTIRIWPSGRVCQAERALGRKVT